MTGINEIEKQVHAIAEKLLVLVNKLDKLLVFPTW